MCRNRPYKFKAVLDLHQKFPNYVYPTIGNHPYNADQDFQEIYNEAHQNKDVIIGIGETGLDYFKNKLSKSRLKTIFVKYAMKLLFL